MKRKCIILMVVILMLAVVFSACGNNGQGQGTGQGTGQQTGKTGTKTKGAGTGTKTGTKTKSPGTEQGTAEKLHADDSEDEDTQETPSDPGTSEKTLDYGSKGALAKEDFTLEEMLVYAIQDEYAAKAEYEKIMEEFNVDRPFSNIVESEITHIALLKPLFLDKGIQIPLDISANYVVIPKTLTEAYDIGIEAEIANIAMY